ncbi:MAG: transcription elongation factor GreA [Bacteroidetes bacterium]|nr:transcription elongation factor GreA [Bacteroidota bacterium]
MADTNYVTQETFDKMQTELHKMKTVDRPAASAAIAEAREKGDLKENAEYDAAKEAQGLLEARINNMESMVANARIIHESAINTDRVSILTKVTLTNMGNKKQVTYHLVSEGEADLKAGKISVTSPIGSGILGKELGDIAEITVPAGVLKFRIDKISV